MYSVPRDGLFALGVIFWWLCRCLQAAEWIAGLSLSNFASEQDFSLKMIRMGRWTFGAVASALCYNCGLTSCTRGAKLEWDHCFSRFFCWVFWTRKTKMKNERPDPPSCGLATTCYWKFLTVDANSFQFLVLILSLGDCEKFTFIVWRHSTWKKN